jgi:hypothetical protein
LRELTPETITDAVLEQMATTPKGLPSIRFDMRLSRESAADTPGGHRPSLRAGVDADYPYERRGLKDRSGFHCGLWPGYL